MQIIEAFSNNGMETRSIEEPDVYYITWALEKYHRRYDHVIVGVPCTHNGWIGDGKVFLFRHRRYT